MIFPKERSKQGLSFFAFRACTIVGGAKDYETRIEKARERIQGYF